ncbi:MAG: flagellar basal body-associated FliL family protein [Ignavibacteriales bacterium]|nr:flagellar basal body-associated FliL family protein [Ignavibacteriales bacterium]
MDEKIDSKEIGESRKAGLNPKVFIIGLPLFIVQLVVIYFITANFLLSRWSSLAEGDGEGSQTEEVHGEKKTKKKAKSGEEVEGKFFFSVEDIIINPAGTNGQRLMLTSVGFSVPTEEQKKGLEEKEVLLKDIVISTLSSKTLSELNQVGYKDSLKVELTRIITERIPELELSDIYFSKYIIQ